MSDYKDKLNAFRELVEKQHNERRQRIYTDLGPERFEVEEGYKFDKVYLVTEYGQKIGRFMVETKTDTIYGIKSWTQVNKRRRWGTLDQIEQWDWSYIDPVPLPGTDAERELAEREQEIKSQYKKRGRKPRSEKI